MELYLQGDGNDQDDEEALISPDKLQSKHRKHKFNATYDDQYEQRDDIEVLDKDDYNQKVEETPEVHNTDKVNRDDEQDFAVKEKPRTIPRTAYRAWERKTESNVNTSPGLESDPEQQYLNISERIRNRNKQKQQEYEQQKEKEYEQQKEKEYEQQKQRELEQQKQKELEQKEYDHEIKRESERQKQQRLEEKKNREIEEQKQREFEQQKQREFEKLEQQEIERQKQQEYERLKHQEIERQKEQEYEEPVDYEEHETAEHEITGDMNQSNSKMMNRLKNLHDQCSDIETNMDKMMNSSTGFRGMFYPFSQSINTEKNR
jgi:hypothetical protein